MNREVHVRVWERAEVKFLRATRRIPKLPRRNIDGCFASVSRHTKTALAVSADKSLLKAGPQPHCRRTARHRDNRCATFQSSAESDRRYSADIQKVHAALDREPGSQAVRTEADTSIPRRRVGLMASREAETFEPVTLVHIRAHGCRDLLVY
jgi:hypothetical protein